MAKFINAAKLLQTTVKFKELTLSQYRQLLKCFIGDDVLPELVFNNTDNIIKNLTNLSQHEIDNLSFLDYCLLLLYIRQTSIGDAVFLTAETIEQKQLKINLQISKIIEQIKDKKILKLLQSESLDICEIQLRLPSIKEIITLENEKDRYSIYTFFLKTIKFSNNIINLQDYSYENRELIVQKIPVKVMTQLTKQTHAIIQYCNQINLLDFLNSDIFDKNLPLALNSQIIAFIIKLVYNTSLQSIYDLMFALSKVANFSCSFLDECSPGEFFLFSKKLEELSAKQQQQQQQQNISINSSKDDLPPIVSEFNVE